MGFLFLRFRKIQLEVQYCYLLKCLKISKVRALDLIIKIQDKLIMSDIRDIQNALIKFRDERDWEQFHNAKDLAVALNIEASELLELFLWKSANEADHERIKEELADVFAYALLLASKYELDVREIVLAKIEKNALKYPINKSKGIAKKYTDL